MTEQVVKSKDLRRKSKEWMAVFFTNRVRKVIEKAVSLCIIIPHNRRVKKIWTSQCRSKFRAQRYGDKLPKSWKALKRKRRCTLHAGILSEGFVNFIPKNDRTANSRDVNPLETIWIIVDETTYKDLLPKTLDELRQWLRCAWKNANYI